MKYDLSKIADIDRAKVFFEHLVSKRTKIEICQKREKRTLSQNSLFHLWVKVFQEHTGDISFDDCKRDVKRAILGVKEVVNRYTGEVTFDDYKTSLMDTKQLSDFMEKFKVWADIEFGCLLPLPEDRGFDDMIDRYNLK